MPIWESESRFQDGAEHLAVRVECNQWALREMVPPLPAAHRSTKTILPLVQIAGRATVPKEGFYEGVSTDKASEAADSGGGFLLLSRCGYVGLKACQGQRRREEKALE